MPSEILKVDSLAQYHKNFGIPAPKNELISIMDCSMHELDEHFVNTKFITSFYEIFLKDKKNCEVEYGRNSFDFNEGVMVFTAPLQVIKPTKSFEKGSITGWQLLFHKDFIRGTSLNEKMDKYSFFHYHAYEALHLSKEEENKMNSIIETIRVCCDKRLDKHAYEEVILCLESLLDGCLCAYKRQFISRKDLAEDIVSQFELELENYINSPHLAEYGWPGIHFFAKKAHLSQHYFSDIVKNITGRTPKNHINDAIIEKSKDLLLFSEDSISKIAFSLGFNYAHYFSRLFRSRTGMTPAKYRNLYK